MKKQELLNDCYKRICELGEGSYGKVYLYQKVASNQNTFIINKLRNACMSKEDKQKQRIGQYFALKGFKSPKDKSSGVDYPTLREIRLLLTLDCDHIIKAYEVIMKKPDYKGYQLYLVMEYMLELPRVLMANSQMQHSSSLRIIAYHVLLGLHYLHQNNIFHRDMKPENIFINRHGLVKIADFGFAREFGTPNKKFTPGVCTLEYRAPEIFFETKYYTEKSDIWSYGCVIAFIHTRKCIFQSYDNNHLEVLKNIFYLVGTPTQETWKGFDKFPRFMKFSPSLAKSIDKQHGIDRDTSEIIEWCLKLDPRKRPTTDELLKHSYFQGLENKRLNVAKLYDSELATRLTG